MSDTPPHPPTVPLQTQNSHFISPIRMIVVLFTNVIGVRPIYFSVQKVCILMLSFLSVTGSKAQTALKYRIHKSNTRVVHEKQSKNPC